ncbi:ACT domain-containing protein [candidate division KSB1 bacterium]|nr:ACT domain-containing protein [candidate division KSB1 bacterium]
MENAFVYRIAHDTTEARLTIIGVPDSSGIGARIFRTLAAAKIHIDMIIYNKVTNGSPNVSFMIWKKDIPQARESATHVAQEIGAKGVLIEDDIARISIIGRGLHNPSGIVAEMFEAFGDEKINIQMISTSETRISCLVKSTDVGRAVKVLVQQFGVTGSPHTDLERSHEEVDFVIPLDAPYDYTLING